LSDPRQIVSALGDAVDATQVMALAKEAADAIKGEAKRQGRWPLNANEKAPG
jgi:hypothetical protein